LFLPSGFLMPVLSGVPDWPLLFWIVTEVKCTGQRRPEPGHSLSEFMRKGLIPAGAGGGRRSDARRLREQMERLFACHISFRQTVTEPHREGQRRLNMDVGGTRSNRSRARYEQAGLTWSRAVMLSPVPFDMRVL
jgi:hypothetical protein